VSKEELLPLFPLQMVLFPNSVLPLHIFEERYKLLTNRCIEGNREFGINFVKDESISEVGCTATVMRVAKRYDDGRMDIEVCGRRRYRLLRYDTKKTPYLVGAVEYFPKQKEFVDPELVQKTIRLYNELIATVYKGRVPEVPLETAPKDLSFILAQKSGMDLQQRQTILELSMENERLKMLHNYFTDVIPKLHQIQEVQRIISSDGYL
jgi:Lon protease-like protein